MANHLERRVAEHLLKAPWVAELSNEVVRRERVAEEVASRPGDAGADPRALHHLFERVQGQAVAVGIQEQVGLLGGIEERASSRAPSTEGGLSAGAEGDRSLLIPLAQDLK